MSQDDIRPNRIMRAADDERVATAATSSKARRVKIQPKETWNIRFLPAQLGEQKIPFIRIAQHWINMRPHFCPRFTAKEYGGNPDYECPLCAVVEELNESASDEVRDYAYRARVSPRYKFWVVVLDQEDKHGVISEMAESEILRPWEFELYKTSWEKLMTYNKRAIERKNGSEWGVFDLETGVNFLATSTTKGIDLDRQDPSPIFKLDDKFDDKIARIWKHIKEPRITIPTRQQLEDMADKFHENALRAAQGKRRRRGDEDFEEDEPRSRKSRRDGDEDDEPRDRRSRRVEEDTDDDQPRRRRQEEDHDEDAAPRRRREEPEDEGAPRARRSRDEESEPSARQAPSRRQAEPEQEPPARRASRTEQQQQESPPPPRRSAPTEDQEPAGDHAGADQGAPPTRRREASAQTEAPGNGPPPRRSPVARTEPDGDNDGDLGPQPRPTADEGAQVPPARRTISTPPRRSGAAPAPVSAAAAPPVQEGVDEEEDNVPEETKDAAPPVEETLPPVNATAPTPAKVVTGSKMEDSMQKRLDRVTRRGA